LSGRTERLFDSVYCAYRGFQRMVRTKTHKLLLYPEARKVQLFDIERDPWEMDNLAEDPALSATISGLFAELKRWQETVSDTLELDPSVFGVRI
jgi:arylsulfatase A-like enzyme